VARRTFLLSRSISTKLGLTFGVNVLNAPVAEPGLMSRRSSYLVAWNAQGQPHWVEDKQDADQLCWMDVP
jgi:hypothetical protein